MTEYHKIQSVFKRDDEGKFMLDQYSTPELEYLADNEWIWSEKIDGTNIRVYPSPQGASFRGRTARATIPEPLLQKLVTLFPVDIYDLFRESDYEAVLYGEGFGHKIQSGTKYMGGEHKVDFVLFDVKIGSWWMYPDRVDHIAQQLEIQIAPTIMRGTIAEAIEFAKAEPVSAWGNFTMEGLVGRPVTQLFDRKRDRIITKVKVKDFK